MIEIPTHDVGIGVGAGPRQSWIPFDSCSRIGLGGGAFEPLLNVHHHSQKSQGAPWIEEGSPAL